VLAQAAAVTLRCSSAGGTVKGSRREIWARALRRRAFWGGKAGGGGRRSLWRSLAVFGGREDFVCENLSRGKGMATKVVDGLFVGDALSSMDVHFIVANKITRIVNCAGLELENRLEGFGLEYLTFEWVADDNFDLLGPNSRPTQGKRMEGNAVGDCPCSWLTTVCKFIGDALEDGQGVLVHSQDGTNRACSCVLVYMMNIYGWDLRKCVSFLQRKRPDLLPSQHYYNQLLVVSNWLEKTYRDAIPDSVEWVLTKFRTWNISGIDLKRVSTRAEEEQLLHNTFFNTDMKGTLGPTAIEASSPKRKKKQVSLQGERKRSVQWIDAEEFVQSGRSLLRSPFSKRVLPERPPGPSYHSLEVTGDWRMVKDDRDERGVLGGQDQVKSEKTFVKQLFVGEKPDKEEEMELEPSMYDTDFLNNSLSMLVDAESKEDAVIDGKKQVYPAKIMVPHLDINSLRAALVEKGVVESFSPHAMRPPSPPLSRRKTVPKRHAKFHSAYKPLTSSTAAARQQHSSRRRTTASTSTIKSTKSRFGNANRENSRMLALKNSKPQAMKSGKRNPSSSSHPTRRQTLYT